MSLRDFLKQCVFEFFVITTCVNVATALLGPVLHPDLTLGFNAFYSPLIAGALGTLPSVILYSKKELNLKQTLVRKSLHLAALETLLTATAWLNGNVHGVWDTLLFMFMVFVIYLAVTLIGLWIENKDAKQINEKLKALQNRK